MKEESSQQVARLLNEVFYFFRNTSRVSLLKSDVFKSELDAWSIIRTAYSLLPDTQSRFELLEYLLRRKSTLSSNTDCLVQVILYLSKELKQLTRELTAASFSSPSLLLCLQLISHCLANVQRSPELDLCISEIHDPLNAVLVANSFECLSAGFSLLVQILRLDTANLDNLLLNLLQNPVHVHGALFGSSYSKLALDIFLKGSLTKRLAFIYAILGSLCAAQWEAGLLPSNLLLQVFPESKTSSSLFSSLDPVGLLFVAKITHLWSQRNKAFIVLQFSMDISENPLSRAFEFCWEMKSCPISVVRLSCLESAQNILCAHFRGCSSCSDSKPTAVCHTMYSLLQLMPTTSWLTRGVLSFMQRVLLICLQNTNYSVVAILSTLAVGSSVVARPKQPQLCRTVSSFLLRCTSDASLSVYVAELYALVASKLRSDDPCLLKPWLEAFVETIATDHKTYGAAISQHVIPKLDVLSPALVNTLIEMIHSADTRRCLPVLLTCYRVAIEHKDSRHGLELVPSLDLLREAMMSSDFQPRIDALNFILAAIRRCKDPQQFSQYLNIYFDFLKTNQWNGQKPLRNQLTFSVYAITKLVLTFHGSDTAVWLKCCGNPFLVRLAVLFLQCIYFGVPPSRLSFGLSGLYRLTHAVHSDSTSTTRSTDVQRPSVFHILCTAARLSCDPWFCERADRPELSSSDSITLADTYGLAHRLFVGLCSTYEEDRECALRIFITAGVLDHLPDDIIKKFFHQSLDIFAVSSRPDVSSAASHFLRLAISSSIPVSRFLPSPCDRPSQDNALVVVERLITVLEDQIHLAESIPDGFLAVASSKPFYSMLASIRVVLTHAVLSADGFRSGQQVLRTADSDDSVPLAEHPGSDSNRAIFINRSWADHGGGAVSSIADRLICMALRISKIILPVLAHASPEGLLPDDDGGDPVVSTDLYSDASETRIYPEYITICCWRSVRELSLILGIHLASQPLTLSVDCDGVPIGLSEQQVFHVSQFFCTQLLCGRHRGALEQCSSGFRPFCRSLYNSPSAALRNVPANWLEDFLDRVLGDRLSVAAESDEAPSFVDLMSRLPSKCLCQSDGPYCVTRRSAGLPIFVQDILIGIGSQRNVNNDLISSVLTRLHQCPEHFSDDLVAPRGHQIHLISRAVVCLNILRVLFRSTELVQPTTTFVEGALCLALNGLGSREWAIRNSSGLLFNTMVERVFGVNRSREAINRKNCLTSVEFITRYPVLKDNIIQIYTKAINDLNTPSLRQAKLFAALFLLTRLLPPHQLSASGHEAESMFAPFVIRFASSCDVRIRQLAARAITCLLHITRVPILVEAYVQQLELLIPSGSKSNFVHGLLLQLEHLLTLKREDTSSVNPLPWIDRLLKVHAIRPATCPLIRKAIMNISSCSHLYLPLNPNHRSLEFEAFGAYAYHQVAQALVSIKNPSDPFIPMSTTLTQLIEPFESDECQLLVLRLPVLLLSDIRLTSLGIELYELCNEDWHTVLNTCRNTQSGGFLNRLSLWIDPVGITRILNSLHGHDRLRSLQVYYALVLLSVALPVTSPTLEAALVVLVQRLSAESVHAFSHLYLPPLVRFIAQLLVYHQSGKHDATLVALLEAAISPVCAAGAAMDDEDLQQSLLYAVHDICSSAKRAVVTGSITMVRFLISALTNFERPVLQELASACCHAVRTEKVDKSLAPPLSCVMFPRFLDYLVRSGFIDAETLIALARSVLKISSDFPPAGVERAREIRVFTQDNLFCIRDVSWTTTEVVRIINESAGSKQISDSGYSPILALASLYERQFANPDWILRPWDLQQRYNTELYNALTTPTWSC